MTCPKSIDYSHLSVEERISLAQELWDSVHEAASALPLTEAQQQELTRRMDAADAGEMTADPWPVVMDRLLKR